MKARIIYNPLSGRAHGEQEIGKAMEFLGARGWAVERRVISPELSATDLARQGVADGCDVIIPAGGDGTINQVIQALATTDVALHRPRYRR